MAFRGKFTVLCFVLHLCTVVNLGVFSGLARHCFNAGVTQAAERRGIFGQFAGKIDT